jgi:RNA polymerase sigma factor (sigma-70 family)
VPHSPLTRPTPGLSVHRTDPDAVPVAELLRSAHEGSQESWNALVDRYSNLLWSVARSYRLDSADAADVVQTTWMRLVENLTRIQDPERLPGWLATTARRECLRTLRIQGREVAAGSDDAPFDLPDDADPLDAGLLTEERDAQLWQCFGQMSGRCQHLLRVLMASPPPSYADVSDALGMPIGSIGPTRGRCLERLRKLAEARGISLAGLDGIPTQGEHHD